MRGISERELKVELARLKKRRAEVQGAWYEQASLDGSILTVRKFLGKLEGKK